MNKGKSKAVEEPTPPPSQDIEMVSASPSTEHFAFERLPYDIRYMVWEMVIASESHKTIFNWTPKRLDGPKKFSITGSDRGSTVSFHINRDSRAITEKIIGKPVFRTCTWQPLYVYFKLDTIAIHGDAWDILRRDEDARRIRHLGVDFKSVPLFRDGALSADHPLGIIPKLESLRYVEINVLDRIFPRGFNLSMDDEGWAEKLHGTIAPSVNLKHPYTQFTIKLKRNSWEGKRRRLEKALGEEREARSTWQPPKVVFLFGHGLSLKSDKMF